MKFKGVTHNTTYESVSGGYFYHRRVIFKSSVLWPGDVPQKWPGGAEQHAGLAKGEFVRGRVKDLKDPTIASCLRRLFVQHTVRGILTGPVASLGVTLLKDDDFHMQSTDDGRREEKKFWNSFRSEPLMEYNLATNGTFDTSFTVGSKAQHIYAMDIVSFGLKGLDVALPSPSPKEQEQVRNPKKRPKAESGRDSDMSGNSDGFLMPEVEDSLPSGPAAQADGAVYGQFEDDEEFVKMFTEMKLYFYQVK